ncbi:hypothetical protein D3C72_1849770 [compost metagenome]
MVSAATETVGSSRCASNCATGTWVKMEVPRSPVASRPSHSKNCRHSGWSSPSTPRSLAMSSTVARSPAISAAGSPGDKWISRKTTTATTAITGSVAARRLSR